MIIEGNVLVFLGAILLGFSAVKIGLDAILALLEKEWGKAAFNAFSLYGSIMITIAVWNAA